MKSRGLRHAYNVILSLGIDAQQLANPLGLPRYLRSLLTWKRRGGKVDSLYPCLGDHKEEAGRLDRHYFLQDLLVANHVFAANPARHVDVGSRLDGFVAHVAAFREVEVLDIRPLSLDIPNIKFRRADLMKLDEELLGCTPSLSCLHALEHFGLGRYGDPIDPMGHRIGFENLSKIVAPGGVLYLSVPVAQEERVEFNAHRVFHLSAPLEWAGQMLALERFWLIDDAGKLHADVRPQDFRDDLRYGCGIYVFRKAGRTF